MGATNLLKGVLPWFQTKVIGVVQTQVASRLSQLFRGETFQRGLSCNRLENRQRDRTMRQLQNRCSGFGSLQAWQRMLARMLLHILYPRFDHGRKVETDRTLGHNFKGECRGFEDG